MILRLTFAVMAFSIISHRCAAFLVLAVLGVAAPAWADDNETIGVTALRRERPSLDGSGIPVVQSEAPEGTGKFEANPVINPYASFTWYSASGSATNFPNSVGLESVHGNAVGHTFYSYSPDVGIATRVPTVDNYEANYFVEGIIVPLLPIRGQVVNQSWIILQGGTSFDTQYDGYASLYNVLFVSGTGNVPEPVDSPGSAYNGICVGIISTNYQSAIGPTSDGRAKPDLVAPHFCCSSISTPLVAGAATLLLQAAATNDGGAGTASIATNASVIKALLLNGAVKMTNWTNGFRRPLDARYGAGVLNAYNSDRQLRGGRRAALATNSVGTGTAHPPTGETNNVASLRGWDYSSIQSSVPNDRVAHYYFNLTTNDAAFSATATLVWKKPAGPLANLDLFLYNTANSNLVTCSTSAVDNVEHLFVPKLAAGRYDLQVLKRGGVGQSGTESYALAFDFSPVKISIAKSDTNVVVAWPASPAGFTLQSAASLSLPVAWQEVSAARFVFSNAQNTATLPASSSMQFFRLFRP